MLVKRENGMVEIDLIKCCEEILRHLIIILIISALVAGIAFFVASKPGETTYAAKGAMYVRPYDYLDGKYDEAEFSSNKPNVVSSVTTMMNTYTYYLTTNDVLEEILKISNADCELKDLKEMITTEIVKDSNAFNYTVTASNPEDAAAIADAIGKVLPEKSMSLIDNSKIVCIDNGNTVETIVSSNNAKKTALIAFVVALFVLCGGVVLVGIIKESSNPLVHGENDLKWMYKDVPVLNDFTAGNKENLLLHDFNKKKENTSKVYHIWEDGFCEKCKVGYRNIRSYIISSLDESASNVVGLTDCIDRDNNIDVTSNIAYTLAQTGKKVIVVDANVYDKAECADNSGISKSGLSDVILNDAKEDTLIKKIDQNGYSFDLLPSGNADNSDDIFSSDKMANLVNELKKKYDYVLISFATAKYSDFVLCKAMLNGIIVITKNEALMKGVTACVDKIKTAGIKLLGFIIK